MIETRQDVPRVQIAVEEMLASLHGLANAISRSAAVEDIYGCALDALQRTLHTDRAAVLLFDAAGVMRFEAWRGLSDGYRAIAEGHSPWAPNTRDPEPLLVPDVLEEASLAALRDYITAEGIRALGFIPLVSGERLLGKFMVYYEQPHAFSAQEVQLAQTIAAQIAFAIERTRAEQALRTSEQRLALYHEITANATEAIAIIDLGGVYVEQNGTHRTLLGFTDEDLRGKTPAVHFGDAAFAAIAEELARHGRHRGEYQSRTKDGRILEIELSGFTVKDAHGEPAYYVGLKRDITERRRAERERTELLERERVARAEAEAEEGRLHQLFMQAPAIVAVLRGADHVFVLANPPYRQMVGGRDVVGKTAREALPELEGQGFFELLDNVYQTGQAFVGNEQRMLVDTDGDGQMEEVFFNFVYQPIRGAASTVEGIFVHVVDVSVIVRSRQRAEELARQLRIERDRLELAQTAGRIGTFEWDLRTGMVPHTAELEALYGLPLGAFGERYEDWLRWVHPDDREPTERTLNQAVAQGGDYAMEFRVVWPDGSIRHLAEQGRVLRDADGDSVRLIGVNVDVTERVELLERERAARAEAEAAVRARDEFLSIASHELRNPVAGLKATAQMLQRSLGHGRLDEERLTRFIRGISGSADRLSALLEDLLDVSRLRTGQLQLRRSAVELSQLVREAIARQQEQHPDRQIVLDLQCDPCEIVADADRVDQVIDNLLSNALKYSARDGEVHLTLGRESAEVVLEVRDEGIGLPAGATEAIFEPFGRAGNARELNVPGMGLGLYICRQIVQSHGGRIWAESSGEGQGTTFHVRLPAAEGPPGA